jgi:hypothetical protein
MLGRFPQVWGLDRFLVAFVFAAVQGRGAERFGGFLVEEKTG